MSENGVKTMKAFAAEIGVHRHTVGDIVAKHHLPILPMTHGAAKGLSPSTQRTIKRLLNIKPAHAATATA